MRQIKLLAWCFFIILAFALIGCGEGSDTNVNDGYHPPIDNEESQAKTNQKTEKNVANNTKPANKENKAAKSVVEVVSSSKKEKKKFNIKQELKFQINYLSEGKLSQGLDFYHKIAEENPSNAVALMLYGNLLLFTNKAQFQDEGFDYLSAALDYDSNIPYIHSSIGLYHEQKKDFAKAELAYKRALKLNPTFPKGKLGLARIAHSRRNMEEGILLAEQVIKTDPKETMAYLVLAQLHMETSRAKALKALMRGAKAVPKDPTIYKALGTFAIGQKKYKEAITHFEQYLILASKNVVDRKQIEDLIKRYTDVIETEETRLKQLLDLLTNLGTPYKHRRKAAKTLEEFPPPWEKAIIHQTVLKALKQDEDHGVRIFCVRALSKHKGSDPKTIELFFEKLKEDDHHQVRTTIVKHLGKLGITKAVPLIINILEEEDAYFMDVANQALNTLTKENYHFNNSSSFSSKKKKETIAKAQEFWKKWAAEHQDWIRENS